MIRALAAALIACALPLLHAQAIDRVESRFLTQDQGRPGTCAPFRLQFEAPEGSTAIVEVLWQNVAFEQAVSVASSPAHAIVPVPVATDVSVRVSVDGTTDSFVPSPPANFVSPSYTQLYVAVFAANLEAARTTLSPEAGVCGVDYFDLAGFFADWRLLDGYDAIVVLNPGDDRLPQGAPRVIAEFCSLGGAVFVAGGLRFGDQGTDLPPPAMQQDLTLHGAPVTRFGYGAGGIYRCNHEALADTVRARSIIVAALRDHHWFGATEPPGGPAPSRAIPADRPWMERGPRGQGRPGPLFWLLAGALFAVTGIGPVLARRMARPAWVAGAAPAVLAAGIGALALLQRGPLPVADSWPLCFADHRADGPASCRSFVLADLAVETWRVDLRDEEQRCLPRPFGTSAWVVDTPLVEAPTAVGAQSRLHSGRVDGANFRDFAVTSREGSLAYSVESAAMADWWLERNAWRGRDALLAACTQPGQPVPPGSELRDRGGLVVIPQR